MSETIKKTEEAVRTKGLTKRYQGKTVLKGLNLSVKTGVFYFRKWASSFRKGIISRRLKYPNFAKRPPVCMSGRQTGGSCVSVSGLGIR